MPEKLEKELKAKARKKFPKDKERQDKHVYSVLRRTGWRPKK